MTYIKPFFRTFLLATLLFVLIIFLGLKYQWGALLKQEDNKVALTIPEKTEKSGALEQAYLTFKPEFEAEVMQRSRNKSLPFSNMTKSQIVDHCSKLSEKLFSAETERYLFVGNCAVSNYRDPIQPVSQPIQENKALKTKKLMQCKDQVDLAYDKAFDLVSIDKMLLLGICVSNAKDL